MYLDIWTACHNCEGDLRTRLSTAARRVRAALRVDVRHLAARAARPSWKANLRRTFGVRGTGATLVAAAANRRLRGTCSRLLGRAFNAVPGYGLAHRSLRRGSALLARHA